MGTVGLHVARSRSGDGPSIRALTSSLSARSSTRCSRGRRRSGGRPRATRWLRSSARNRRISRHRDARFRRASTASSGIASRKMPNGGFIRLPTSRSISRRSTGRDPAPRSHAGRFGPDAPTDSGGRGRRRAPDDSPGLVAGNEAPSALVESRVPPADISSGAPSPGPATHRRPDHRLVRRRGTVSRHASSRRASRPSAARPRDARREPLLDLADGRDGDRPSVSRPSTRSTAPGPLPDPDLRKRAWEVLENVISADWSPDGS